MSPLGFLGSNAHSCHVSLESASQGGGPFPIGFDFPHQGWTPRKRSPRLARGLCDPWPSLLPCRVLALSLRGVPLRLDDRQLCLQQLVAGCLVRQGLTGEFPFGSGKC